MNLQFDNIIQEYAGLLSRVAGSYEANESLRQELYQDICVAVWQGLNSYRGDASIKTFLLRIAHNRCITYVSKEVNRIKPSEYREYSDEDSTEPTSNISADIKPPSPEQKLIEHKQLQHLMH